MPQQQGLLRKALQVWGGCPRDRARLGPEAAYAIRDSALGCHRYALPETLQALSICERGTCALALLLGHNLQ